jgi:hypothetical protein
MRWHRQWLRGRWTERSDRPRTDAAIRALLDEMASANPLWGAPRIHGELQRAARLVRTLTARRLIARLPKASRGARSLYQKPL